MRTPSSDFESERSFELFGTRVRLLAGDPGDPGLPAADAVLLQIEGFLRIMQRRLTRFEPQSELCALNAAPGGVVRVSGEDAQPLVAMSVEDTGEGIAPAELDRVWERFYRTGDARDRDGGGAGLGLALVKELAEAMDGRVEVESTVGVGSRFSVYLPATREVPLAHEERAATRLRHTDDRAATRR